MTPSLTPAGGITWRAWMCSGSVLRSDYRPGESDIDLLVEFLPLDSGSLYKASFALLNDLRLGLASRVDLVMADAVRNPYVKQSIEASKQQIYAA
ncbi:nucleotidyltransferase domain-containing protein [Synechococcus sp. UW140]|uniref:nucleotidyltransferase family protein n=1 Tax=Synechococcus sp. UW140 TaxID=368503 RepID=UPI003137EC17